MQKPPQQVLQILGLQFRARQVEEGLRFGFAHLIIRVVERQDDAELQLLARPAEILVFIRIRKHQDGIENAVVLAQRPQDVGWGHVQLGEAPATVLNQFKESVRRRARRENAGRRAGRDVAQRFDLPDIETGLA